MFNFEKCRYCKELDIMIEYAATHDTKGLVHSHYPKCLNGVFYADSKGLHITDVSKCSKHNENECTMTLKVTGCKDCPYCKTAYTFGNDGRDGKLVYVCEKGAFGKRNDVDYYGFSGYATGPYKIPRYPGRKCPLFNITLIKAIASKLDMSESKLKAILDSEGCEIITKKEI